MVIYGLVAGSLPTHRRGTRRKYIKVPRRWLGKDQSRWSVCLCEQCMQRRAGADVGHRCPTDRRDFAQSHHHIMRFGYLVSSTLPAFQSAHA
ncbi:hypothetical protein XarCFBP6762_13010 [Xanthomonas arboricola]|nr:hypothetical protein XarCFBP6762_13010 [Xanthomonas arboricola]